MADVKSRGTDIDIRRYWDVLMARWPAVFVFVGVGILLAIGYLVVAPRSYVATTTLSVFPITTDPYAANRNSNNLIDMSAESVAASSFKIAELAVAGDASSWEADELQAATRVSAAADSTTMTLSVTASSEKLARAGATAMADSYLLARSDQAAESIASVTARDSARIDDHRAELTDAIGRLAVAEPGSPAAAEASADQQIINAQISALLSRMSSLEGIDTTGGVVLDPASLTAISVEPSTTVVLLTGLAGGFVVGIVAAFFTHSRNKTVRSARDVRREAEVDTLGPALGGDDDAAAVAVCAQRLLRLVEIHDARIVSVVVDRHATGSSDVADLLAESIRASGVAAAVGDPRGVQFDSPHQLVLLPVPPTADRALRLQALRISDVCIVVLGIGVSKVRMLRPLAAEAADMGTGLIGAVLIQKQRSRRRRVDEPSEGVAETVPGDAELWARAPADA